MDSIFDIFFEHKIESLERCGLKTRQNRTDVIDHLNAVISGFAEGQSVSPDVSCQLAIAAAINYHRTQKEKNATICMMGKYHNVLYVALKVAWDWGVKDSSTICQLLQEIFCCEGTFERLFLGAIFGTSAPHFIAGWKADFKDQEENCLALVYYLEHATRLKLTFPVAPVAVDRNRRAAARDKESPVQSTRFIDVPIESCGSASPLRVALQASAPDLLLLLLRFGANPLPQDDGCAPITALLDKLLEIEGTGSHSLPLLSCLKILLRAFPVLDLPFKPLVFRVRRERCLEKYGSLVANGLLPMDTLFGIPSLKTLCRFCIREELRRNFQLPHGIQALTLPTALKHYLDLMDEEAEDEEEAHQEIGTYKPEIGIL